MPTVGERTDDSSELSLREVCARLQASPQVVRNLCEEFSEWLAPRQGEEGQTLPADQVRLLERIYAWRNEGLSTAQIKERLAAPVPREEASATWASELVERIAELTEELGKSERRRAEDRDRLMMALVRTQQEIQHLRYEVAAARSRRERKRGLWARLFG